MGLLCVDRSLLQIWEISPCVCMIGLIVNSRKIDIGRQAKPRILYFITKNLIWNMKYIYRCIWFSEKWKYASRQNKIWQAGNNCSCQDLLKYWRAGYKSMFNQWWMKHQVIFMFLWIYFQIMLKRFNFGPFCVPLNGQSWDGAMEGVGQWWGARRERSGGYNLYLRRLPRYLSDGIQCLFMIK